LSGERPIGTQAENQVGAVRSLARRAVANKAYVYTAAALAPVASVATIVLVIRDLLNLDGPGWSIVLVVLVGVLIVGAVVALYNEQDRHRTQVDAIHRDSRDALVAAADDHKRELAQYVRAARMYMTLPHLHQVFHEARDAMAVLLADERGGGSAAVDAVVFAKLQTILSEFAAAFSDLTGVACRASIKSLDPPEAAPDHLTIGQGDEDYADALVSTLARHDRAANRLDLDGPVKISDNTDFLYLLRSSGGGLHCFLSNDLDADPPEYRNSHRSRDHETDPRPAYNSTMVWPIQMQSPGQDHQRFGLVGFLCVDSLQKDVFVKTHDFELGAAVADGLFNLIWLWRSGASVAWPSGGSDSIASDVDSQGEGRPEEE